MAVYVAWGGVDRCHGVWKRGTCVFGVEDLPNLITRRELFANKFYQVRVQRTISSALSHFQTSLTCHWPAFTAKTKHTRIRETEGLLPQFRLLV